MTRALFSGAILISLILAGCATPPPTPPDPTPTITSTPDVTVTPSATPPLVKPALYDLVIAPEGLGPLHPGQVPPVNDPLVDILVFDPDGCPDRGIWLSNYGVDPATNEPGPFGVLVLDGVIDTIGIYDPGLTTAAGAHLGMTRDELLAAYPTGLEREFETDDIDTYRLRGDGGDLIFGLWERDPGVFTVNQINISHSGFQVPLGGSDYGYFGVCFGA